MKTILFALFAMTMAAFGADAPPAVPPPTDAINLLNLIITGLTPVVIFGVKKVVPTIPTVLLPVAAPVVGIGVDFALRKAGIETGGAVAGAVWGALGVWLRELQDQVRAMTPFASAEK